MALSLGKLTLLVGAGIIGSVLVKEGRVPSVSDVLSGALKIALKPIRQNDSADRTIKPRNDALIAQVNNLRQELQLLASNRSAKIVSFGAKGGLRYGGIIVIVVIGCGYVWWKGWKLPDLTFATQRGLADACNSVAKELEKVYSAISDTDRDVSSHIEGRTKKYEEIAMWNESVQDEVAELREDVRQHPEILQTIIKRMEYLETNVHSIEGGQLQVADRVGHLMKCSVSNMENRDLDLIQDSPSCSSRRPALENHPQITSSSRTASLPVVLPSELPSPSAAYGSNETSQGIFEGVVKTVGPLPSVSNVSPMAEYPQRQQSIFRRTFSATQHFK